MFTDPCSDLAEQSPIVLKYKNRNYVELAYSSPML